MRCIKKIVFVLIFSILLSTINSINYTNAITEEPITSPPILSNINIANNKTGIDDVVEINKLDEGDLVSVYNSATGGTLLGSSIVQSGQTSVQVIITQLGVSAGTVYITLKKDDMLESKRTAVSYTAETLKAPAANNIKVINNKVGLDDTVEVMNLIEGTSVNIYNASSGGVLLGSSTVEEGKSSVIVTIPQIGINAGYVYVALTMPGKLESTRTAQSYTSEITSSPAASYITVVNNYIGSDDVISVSGLSEGDEIKVYTASTAGTLIVSGVVEVGQTSVVLSVPQLGSTSGTIYVSLTKVNKLESTRTQKSYTAEPITTALVAASITVANNKAGIDDTVKVTSLVEGDTVTVYSASTGGTVLGSTTVPAGQTSAVVVIPQIGTGAGSVYVTIKKEGKLESTRTAQSYTSETTVAPLSSYIKVVNNYIGTDDVITVTGLSEGDEIKVYTASTAGTLIVSGVVEVGQTTVVLNVPQLGSTSGTIYVSLTKVNKLESTRTQMSYAVEPTTTALSAASITVTNNKSGIDDTVKVTSLVEGDTVTVYSASTGGTVMGSTTVEAGQTSAVVVISQMGTGAGSVYVTIKKEGKLESTRTAQSYTSETTVAPSSSYIKVVNNYIGTDDVITVTGLSEGDEIKVYTASTAGTLIVSGVVEAGQTSVVLNVPQLGSAAGKIYVSVTKVNKLESTRTQISYAVEPTTTALSAASITVTNNKAGIDDTVKVTNLVEGDTVTVYSASTGGTVLGSTTVEAGQTSAVVVISQMGTGAGSVYVTIKKEGKLESTRTMKGYSSELSVFPSTAIITVNNTYYGIDDTITVSGILEGDEIKVYNASKEGTLLAVGKVQAGQNSLIISVPQLGLTAGTIYLTITTVTNLESTRISKTYTAEPTPTEPIANAIAAVIKAETSKLRSDSDFAKTLVNNLSDSSTKTTLTGRLDALQILIDIINAVPTNLRASYVGITNISLVWDAPSYKVAGYKIYRNGQEIGTTLGTEYTDINLLQATFYNYYVKAYDAGGNISNKSSDINIKTDRVAESPSNLKAINFGSYIILSWDSVEDAVGYQIYINGHVENVTSTEFSHINVQVGQEYTYKIRTVYTNKISDWSSEISKNYSEQLEINPPVLTVNTMTNKITVSWNTFPHVTGYEIEADGKIIEFGNDIMNYTHSNLLSNSSHTYKVRFISGDCRGDWSQPLTAKTGMLSKPSNVNYVAFANSIELRWMDVAEADSYEIEINSRLDKTFVTVTESDYINVGLFSNTAYSYRVRAVNSGGVSDWSDVIKCTTGLLDAPDNIVKDITNNQITISWDPVSGASQYDVYVDGEIKTTGQETKFIHSNLEPNTTHTYKIRAVNNYGFGEWSYIYNITTLLLDVPTNIGSIGSENSIKLYWDNVENVTGYDVEIDGATVNTVTINKFLVYPLASGTIHKFRVRAKNSKGISAWSTSGSQLVTNPEKEIKGEWIQNGAMLNTRNNAGSTQLDGKIYVIGGYYASKISSANEIYNPETGDWVTRTSMPTARYGLGVANVNGKIYAIGGYDGSNFLSTVEEYDPNTDSWVTKTAMPTPRNYFGIAVLNGKIYAIGGYNKSSYLNTVEEYDPITDKWTTKVSMPTARKGLGLAVLNDKLYAIDGYNGTALGNVEEYDQTTDKWLNKGELGISRYSMKTIVTNERIFIIGGLSSNDSKLSTVEEYNPATNTYVTLNSLPAVNYEFAVEAVDNNLYVIGGLNKDIKKFILSVPTNRLAAPYNICTNMSTNTINIFWDTVTGATSYDIEIDGLKTINTTTNTYSHYPVTLGIEHTYRIRTNNIAGAGEWSEKITAINPDVTYSSSVVPILKSNSEPVPFSVQVSNINSAQYAYTAFNNQGPHWYVSNETPPTGGHYIRIDLGESNQKRITKIVLYSFSNGTNCSIKNWELWASNDDTNYTKLTQGIQPNNAYSGEYIFENPNLYRYYRLHVLNSYYDPTGASVGVCYWQLMCPQELAVGINTPMNFSASSTSKNSMDLLWASVSGATSYDIDCDGTLISVSGTSYTHSNLLPGTIHKYRIRARTSTQVSNWSDVVIKSTLINSPTNLTAEASGSSIILKWDPVPDAVGYYILADGKGYDNGTSTTFTDSGLIPNTSHSYKVKVKTSTNDSGYNTSITCYAASAIPVGISDNPAGTFIAIKWQTVSGATSYDIRINGAIVGNVTTTSYTHTELVPNRQYTVQVRARNSGGASDWSQEYKVTTLKHKGTVDDPYPISCKNDLISINKNLEGYYKLTSDIDLENIEWEPIGSSNMPFRGTIDGDGYTISNLSIMSRKQGAAGLFGVVENATLKNINIRNVNINLEGFSRVGTLVGYALKNSFIQKCSVKGSGYISGAESTGGLIGTIINSSVTDCSSNVTVEGTHSNYSIQEIGGLIGCVKDSEIIRCYATGQVTSIRGGSGGLIGICVLEQSSSNISECYSTGNVTGLNQVGGLIGKTDARYCQLIIENCFALGNVRATSLEVYTEIGGLIGSVRRMDGYGRISNCYSTGTITTERKRFNGGFIGSSLLDVIDCYYDGVSSVSAPQSNYDNSRMSTSMVRQNTFKNWDFNDTWSIDENKSYPYLKNMPKPLQVTPIIDPEDASPGKGTIDDPYIINSKRQLNNIRYELNSCYKLACDIDLESVEWEPVGNENMPFRGTIDGNGYTISNLSIMSSKQGTAGLFGAVENATIKNINIRNVNLNLEDMSSVGALVGYALRNSIIRNCSVKGSGHISGAQNTGGLIGTIKNGSVSDCSSTVTVKGTYTSYYIQEVGGLIGCVKDSEINRCYAIGQVTSTNGGAGGLIGKCVLEQSSSNISECYSTGDVTGVNRVGGLIGQADSHSIIINCYALGNVEAYMKERSEIGGLVGSGYGEIFRCYSTGTITAMDSYWKGGLIGIGRTIDCYFNSENSGITTPSEQARTTSQLMTQSTFTNWDFTSIWAIQEGSSYPFLKNLVNPLGISVSNVGSDSISIFWNPVDGANSYELEVDGVILNEALTEPNFIHSGLQPKTTHTYRFRTHNKGIVSDWSPLLTVITLAVQIAVPKNVSAVNINDQIKIRWDAVAEAKEYEIEVDGQIISVGSFLEYIDNNFSNISQHIYRIRAKNSVAISEWSEVVSQVNWKENTPAICLYESNWLNTDSADDEVEIIVKANNVKDMYTVQMTLEYNPSQLILNKNSISQLLWNDDTTGYFQYAVDESKGMIKILISAKADGDSKSGLVDILGLKFRLNAIDKSTIKVNKAYIVNSSGMYIKSSDVADLSIHVIK